MFKKPDAYKSINSSQYVVIKKVTEILIKK